MYDVEFDLTAEYADRAAVRAALPLMRDGWAYVVDRNGETAVVSVMSTTSAFYAPQCNLTLVRTYEECVNELGRLVGV